MSGVRIRGLTRRFGDRTVLDRLDLDLAPGSFTALLGRSGSGKTTLLRTLAGLDPAPADAVVAVPQPTTVVFQEPRLLPWAPVWQNVGLGLDAADARARAEAALHEVGLGRHLDAWPLPLSGGEAQRVALARALVRLAENRMPRSGIALAIASRGALGWRVQRLLLAPEAVGPTSRRWFARTLGTMALALAVVCGARLGVADTAIADLHVASAFGPVVAVNARDPAGSFALRIHRGRVIEASVEHQPLARASIRQRGDRVTLLGAMREPIVSFRVTPQGRIEWPARVAKLHRD